MTRATRRRIGPPVGVLLAGGRARRMGGGDKGLCRLGGRTLLDHVVARLGPQVDRLVLSANGDPARFADCKLPVVADPIAGHAGPLAGVLGAMLWVREHRPETVDIVTVPIDTPFLPTDLVCGLQAARQRAGCAIALAASAGRLHPVVGLWPVHLAEALAAALAAGERRTGEWALGRGAAVAAFAFTEGTDPFLNINRPEELAEAERVLSRGTPSGAAAGPAPAPRLSSW
jgi:molybdenum cofactor guanylyltransferase